MIKKRNSIQLGLILVVSMLMSGCGVLFGRSDATATLNVTQAYQTVEARLTQAAERTPSATITLTPTEIKTATPTNTSIPTAAAVTNVPPTNPPAPATACDLAGAGNPIDVTIPDDTQFQPGASFTKIWRLQNAGTCEWTTGYKAVLFSGDAMEAQTSIQLPSNVPPGGTVDISVDMVAPDKAGTYQGNWKLQNTSGTQFGIGPSGGSAFWVRIIVSGSTTVTPTTGGPTNTPTIPVQASGTQTLSPDDTLDLDNNQKNSGNPDVEYLKNGQNIALNPVNGAQIGIYGGNRPSLSDCQNTSLGGGSVDLTSYVGQSLHLCFVTNQGRDGRMYITNYDGENLTLQFTTWAQP